MIEATPTTLESIDRVIAQTNSIDDIDKLLDLKRKAFEIENYEQNRKQESKKLTRIIVASYLFFGFGTIMIFLSLPLQSIYLTVIGSFLLVISVTKLLEYKTKVLCIP